MTRRTAHEGGGPDAKAPLSDASAAPVTLRTPGKGAEGTQGAPGAFIVGITYREPVYAQRSGTDKPYSSRFVVQAADEQDAIAQAKAEFQAMAATSGVGWIRIIERIDCRRADDTDAGT